MTNEHERHRQERIADRVDAERRIGRRKIRDRLIAEQHIRQTAKQRQRANDDRERGKEKSEAHDHEAVEQARKRSEQHTMMSGIGKLMCQSMPISALDAPSTEAHRQIDLRRDDDERHRQRNERDLGKVREHVRDVRGGQKHRREHAARDQRHDEHDDEHCLPLQMTVLTWCLRGQCGIRSSHDRVSSSCDARRNARARYRA